MERLWTTELAGHVGEPARLAGWMQRSRALGGVMFVVLRDGRGTAQVVIDDPGLAAQVGQLHAESVLSVTGTVVAAAQAPGGVELRAERVDVLSAASEPPPVELFRPAIPAHLSTILDHAPVALRHVRQRAYLRLQAASMVGFRSALADLGFVEIQTPKIVASATESGANVFQIDYFGRPAYLAQSPQFYKQMMVGVFERVFEIGPVFRAEPHDTARHLNEYVSCDLEMGFIQDHWDVMRVLTGVIRHMLTTLAEQADASLRGLGVTLPAVPATIPAIHFADALDLIARETGEETAGEPDLAPAHERWLGDWALREHGSDLLFVTGYPMAKRPFYTHPDPARPAWSNSFDLLFRGLELVTGGQRLHRYDDYLAALAARGQDPEPLRAYLETFKHGMPPHGGFALGLERWVAQLAGVANVREVALFPRDLGRLTP